MANGFLVPSLPTSSSINWPLLGLIKILYEKLKNIYFNNIIRIEKYQYKKKIRNKIYCKNKITQCGEIVLDYYKIKDETIVKFFEFFYN